MKMKCIQIDDDEFIQIFRYEIKLTRCKNWRIVEGQKNRKLNETFGALKLFCGSLMQFYSNGKRQSECVLGMPTRTASPIVDISY